MASTNAVREVVPPGDWLFKMGELTLGPVPGAHIVERLYASDLNGATPITPLGQNAWRPLRDVEIFKVHLAKAEAKWRVDATARARADQARKGRNVRIGITAAIAVALAVAAASTARYLAVHNPWRSGSDLALMDITVSPPKIAFAHRGSDEDLVAYPTDGKGGGFGSHTLGSRHSARSAGGSSSSSSSSSGMGAADPNDGLQMGQVDQEAINQVVAAKQRTLYPCFVEEAHRTPGLSARIPIEFAIGNDGRVNKLWVDNPRFKQGPLADCLLRELQKWPFKGAQSSGASVKLSFQIGHPS